MLAGSPVLKNFSRSVYNNLSQTFGTGPPWADITLEHPYMPPFETPVDRIILTPAWWKNFFGLRFSRVCKRGMVVDDQPLRAQCVTAEQRPHHNPCLLCRPTSLLARTAETVLGSHFVGRQAPMTTTSMRASTSSYCSTRLRFTFHA